MAAHWKFGDGFAIRYGGYKDIQWFFGSDFHRAAKPLPLPPIRPVALLLEAAQSTGLFLLWWEQRKQTQIATVQFEERRISWLLEMLAQWHGELHGERTLRLDTVRYLDRELSRLMEALDANAKMDLPSVLLLQVERTAKTLALLNTFVSQELLPPTIKATPTTRNLPVVKYKPYWEFDLEKEAEEGSLATYINTISKIPLAIPGPVVATLVGTLWGVKNFFQMKKKDRGEDLLPLQALALELRSAHALLTLLQDHPLSLQKQEAEAIYEGHPLEVISLEPSRHLALPS